MICCDDQKVIIFQFFQQNLQFFVKHFQLFCIAFRVSSVSPFCIKIHQIYKTKPMKVLLGNVYGLFHTVNRRFGFIGFCDSFSIKNVFDFSYRDHIQSMIFQYIQSGFHRWFQSVVVTVAGPLKFPFLLSDIRSCNNPSHSPFFFHGQFSGDLTAAVQFLQAEGLLISADLEYRVR